MKQQHLAISLKPPTDFASFYPGANRLVINSLKQITPGDFIYLWGASGVGVSHLLQACCATAQTIHQRTIYLDLKWQAALGVELLEGLEDYDVIAIDHLEAVVGISHWEHAIFHLYNRIQAKQHSFIVGAHVAPMALELQLADLASRLKAMLVLQLKVLNDADKLFALQQRATQLGLDLPTDVGQYLLNHAERDLTHLLSLLNRLDQASLRAQRKLTIPFVKQILAT